MCLTVSESTVWRIATKTRPIVARHVSALSSDLRMLSRLLISTLEGREPVGSNSMICVGEGGDAWQQAIAKLFAKYTVVSVDSDGWLVCHPKPDNAVDVVEATQNC